MQKVLTPPSTLESFFHRFREQIIGNQQEFESPYGKKRILYADWTASGRLYRHIEEVLMEQFGPFVANTHTETNVTGSSMTLAYHEAKNIIKRHVGAREKDVLISSNSGMTGVVNKFQRILGLKLHEKFRDRVTLHPDERPVVFVTHMEHHSNQTSWLETIAEVHIINATEDGQVDLEHLETLLNQFEHRPFKIAAVTSCSNVTGIITPYHEIARKLHRHGGYCFVDFAASAPYIDICMHPEDAETRLDAIFFSPHKFLGGPGTTGILIFDPVLYNNKVPDHPGGGTVDWTNPWGEHKYMESIEAREDGGTPAFLPTMKVALCVLLKEQMGVQRILEREHEQLEMVWKRLCNMPHLKVLAPDNKDRLAIISFYIDGLHYNLGVKLLNDRFGIQIRGGCSCAGTYGHYLLDVSMELSRQMTSKITVGDLSAKLGWMRMSFHPTMTNAEMEYLLDALQQLHDHHEEWAKDYQYLPATNEFIHHSDPEVDKNLVKSWFFDVFFSQRSE